MITVSKISLQGFVLVFKVLLIIAYATEKLNDYRRGGCHSVVKKFLIYFKNLRY